MKAAGDQMDVGSLKANVSSEVVTAVAGTDI